MHKVGVLICLLLWGIASYSQPVLRTDSTMYFISRLNENSCKIVVTGYFTTHKLDDNAIHLIKLSDKNKLTKLLAHIKEPDKTYAINIILHDLLKPDDSENCWAFEPQPQILSLLHLNVEDSLRKYNQQLNEYINSVRIPNQQFINCVYDYWKGKIK